jgi:spermidine synthase
MDGAVRPAPALMEAPDGRSNGDRAGPLSVSWFFVFFLLSGFCGLIYEVVWLRLAMASFGVTTALVSIVLSVFMGGLALGSGLVGRLTRRLSTGVVVPLRLYALTELLIALSGLVVPVELEWGRRFLGALGAGISWGSSAYYVASAAWIALALVPFAACMGATFPLAMTAIARSAPTAASRTFSYLYLANVLGAASGTLASAFVMIDLLGFSGTLLAAATLNASLAASAFGVSFAVGRLPSSDRGRAGSSPSRSGLASARPAALGLLFATGVTSMAMEVVWIRQFTPYLGTVVYAFAIVLAVYLAATFLGSGVYRVFSRASTPGDPDPAPSWLWPVVGLAGLIPLVAADPRVSAVSTGAGARGLGWSQVAHMALGITPFCALVGFLTPMLVDRWSAGGADRAGGGYAVNVLGSLVGPLVAGFVLLPAISERSALLVLAGGFLIIGGVTEVGRLARARDRRGHPDGARALHALTTTAALGLAALVVVFTEDFEALFPRSVVRHDSTATVIAHGEGWQRQLLVNGVGMTDLTPIAKMMAHLPMASLASLPRRSLVICFGMGTTFRSLLSWGAPVTAVELVPSVPALFGYYHADGGQLVRSPLATIVIDDGRRFLARTPESYDVITIDPPPPPEAAGSSLLYSREFYALAKTRLHPGGMLQQWLPAAEPFIAASVARALEEAFPHVRVFRYRGGLGWHFLASAEPILKVSASQLAARMPPAASSDLVEWNARATAEDYFRQFLETEIPLRSVIDLAPQAPALQDDRPVNEYFFLRRTFPSLRS